jgi:hypothetical protein
MALAVEEVLRVWRELERVDGALPADDPDRRVIAAEVVELKRLYRRLTVEAQISIDRLQETREVIVEARHVLDVSRHRLDRSRARW